MLVTAASRPIPRLFWFGQLDFGGAGCSEHPGNDLSCNTFIRSLHAHQSDEIHFECEVFHGNSNVTVAVFVPLLVQKENAPQQLGVTRVTSVRFCVWVTLDECEALPSTPPWQPRASVLSNVAG